MTAKARTLFARIWDEHVVVDGGDARPSVLYIDLHLVHEVTSPQAFEALQAQGLSDSEFPHLLGTALQRK